MIHQEARRSIGRHFDGRLDPSGEASMREHLAGCADCRARYGRHLLYARLTRTGLPPQERLAHGLGLRGARRAARGARPAVPAAITGAIVALAAVVLLLRARPFTRPDDGEFAARGSASAPVGALWVYRFVVGGRPEAVKDGVSRADELAFAYGNAAGKKYVTIFAFDEHRHVYWYYPAWPNGAAAPMGVVPARAGPGPHELPEATRHAFDGQRIDLVTVLSDEPVNVALVEREVTANSGVPDGAIAPRGAVVLRRTLDVWP